MGSAYKPERVRLGTLTYNFSARRALGEHLGYILCPRDAAERWVVDNGMSSVDEIFEEWANRHPDADYPNINYRAQQKDSTPR